MWGTTLDRPAKARYQVDTREGGAGTMWTGPLTGLREDGGFSQGIALEKGKDRTWGPLGRRSTAGENDRPP